MTSHDTTLANSDDKRADIIIKLGGLYEIIRRRSDDADLCSMIRKDIRALEKELEKFPTPTPTLKHE